MKNTIGLGDIVERIINFVTFGYGKRIATAVSKFLDIKIVVAINEKTI